MRDHLGSLIVSSLNLPFYRYVDLGLGTHRVKCRVHEDFRLIVVAEDREVERFPIPLINRLEKHYLGMETMVEEEEELAGTVEELKAWAEKASRLRLKSHERQEQYGPQDVFIGYHEDVIASMVLRMRKRMPQVGAESVVETVKRLLLQCATPDAISRLSETELEKGEQETLFSAYHLEQNHANLAEVLRGIEEGCKLVQVCQHLD